MSSQKSSKILASGAYLFAIIGLVLAVSPLLQIYGGILGVMCGLIGLFLHKYAREESRAPGKSGAIIRISFWAIFFGIIVAGGCKIHSRLAYIGPLNDEAEEIKEQTKKQLLPTAAKPANQE